jgi:hypothetical protein
MQLNQGLIRGHYNTQETFFKGHSYDGRTRKYFDPNE